MAGFADLILAAQPRLCDVIGAATAGATWRWSFADLTDSLDDPVDLTDVTGECLVHDAGVAGVDLVLAFAGDAVGGFVVSIEDEDVTAAVPSARSYRWSLRLERGEDVVQVWGPDGSSLRVDREH